VHYFDQMAFRRWCASAKPVLWAGQVNLRGLRPLLQAEIWWCLFAYTQRSRPGQWDLTRLQRLANLWRYRDLNSLVDLDLKDFPRFCGGIAKVMLHQLRLIYFTPADSKDAGFLETDQFGVRFPHSASHVDLTAIPQRWLRVLLWDHLTFLLRSPSCPRTGMPVDAACRGITELGVFLETGAPSGGNDPAALDAAQHRAHVAVHLRPAAARTRRAAFLGDEGPGQDAVHGHRQTRIVFNSVHNVLREAMDTGRAEHL
jgi:hypothetical protein